MLLAREYSKYKRKKPTVQPDSYADAASTNTIYYQSGNNTIITPSGNNTIITPSPVIQTKSSFKNATLGKLDKFVNPQESSFAHRKRNLSDPNDPELQKQYQRTGGGSSSKKSSKQKDQREGKHQKKSNYT